MGSNSDASNRSPYSRSIVKKIIIINIGMRTCHLRNKSCKVKSNDLKHKNGQACARYPIAYASIENDVSRVNICPHKRCLSVHEYGIRLRCWGKGRHWRWKKNPQGHWSQNTARRVHFLRAESENVRSYFESGLNLLMSWLNRTRIRWLLTA